MHRQPTEATVENSDHPKSRSITSSSGRFFRPNSSLNGGRRGPHTGEKFPPQQGAAFLPDLARQPRGFAIKLTRNAHCCYVTVQSIDPLKDRGSERSDGTG